MHARDRAFPTLEGFGLTLAGRKPREEGSLVLDAVDADERVGREKRMKLALIPEVDMPLPRILGAVGHRDRHASTGGAKPAKSSNG